MWIYILATLVLIPLLRKYFNGPMCKIQRDLSTKVVIVTGANTGIGRETARSLAAQGATVILACRSKQRTQQTLEDLQKSYGRSKIVFQRLDVSDLKSVQEFVAEFTGNFQKLDLLINNAGLMSPTRQVTPQNIELQFATNHIGPFALTLALIPLLQKSSEARVINVSSMMHQAIYPGSGKIFWDDLNFEKRGYQRVLAYSQTKLANILFAKQLQKLLDLQSQVEKCARIKCVSLHPGSVMTDFLRDQKWIEGGPIKFLFYKNVFYGAQTSIFCALEDFDKLVPGGYYSDCALKKSSEASNDPANAERLWRISVDIVRQKGFGDLVQNF